MSAKHDAPILTRRDLNRASLARQMLLERASLPIETAVSHLVALQAQAHRPPYIGLWCRLRGVTIAACDRLLTDRALVRLPLMRGTLHVATAEDALAFAPLFEDLLARSLHSNFGRRLSGIDTGAVAKAAEAMLDRAPQTYADLGRVLAKTWSDHDPAALAQVARQRLSLVQAPPLLWHSAERPRVMTQRGWLKRAPGAPPTREMLVQRYLAAFGPASVADMQKWFGMTGFRPVVNAMTELRRFRNAEGDDLYDMEDAPRPDAATAAPVRLLPGFDGVVLGYRDPSRFVAPELLTSLSTRNGLFHPVFLIDGRIAGLWKMEPGKSRLSVAFEPFAELSGRDRSSLAEEAEALSRFTGHDRAEVSFHGA